MEDKVQTSITNAYRIGFVEGEINALKTKNEYAEKAIEDIRLRQDQMRSELKSEQKELKDDIQRVKIELSSDISEAKIAADKAKEAAESTRKSIIHFCGEITKSFDEKLKPITDTQTEMKTAWKTIVVVASAISGTIATVFTILSFFLGK